MAGNYSDSDEDIPLAQFQSKYKQTQTFSRENGAPDEIQIPITCDGSVETLQGDTPVRLDDTESMPSEVESDEMSVCDYDSDRDPEFSPGACELRKCKAEVWAACHDCEVLLCFDHFNEDVPTCAQHGKSKISRKTLKSVKEAKEATPKESVSSNPTGLFQTEKNVTDKRPEQYTVEGSEKEVKTRREPRPNKQKEAKRKRALGQEYTSTKTKKSVAARQIKERCKGETCLKQNKLCSTVTDEQRQLIFDEYHSMGNLCLQREFLVRHVTCNKVKRKYTEGESRRSNTRQYMLTAAETLVPVCKVFFLNTLGIAEQSVRTALNKVTPMGTLGQEQRGGRQSEKDRDRDELVRTAISEHIDRFPKVESHYCREKSTREYLSPELTKKHMYHMFLKDWIPRAQPPSFTTYLDVFKGKNLSIHRPKKDQCTLCVNYHEGNEDLKRELEGMYLKHVGEKDKVREIKGLCKQEAIENSSILCASFDLQQVIYLPISQESAIFYKRRLSNYNLTFYNIADRDCHCFFWDETQSKRGSSEISTCVFKALKFYDEKGIKKAYLFADGCSGQNKNSITPAMMLYAVTYSSNLEEISLRFFQTNHGQNEGDSAHSAIGHAVKKAGDLFLPSQVTTVISLARPQKPYIVHHMQASDFLDFKALSRNLRILDTRRGSDLEETFAWNDIMEMRVMKDQADKIYYKTSHFDTSFKILSLKRLKKSVQDHTLEKLNLGPTNISKEKFNDLTALCSGPTSVVKLQEHKAFYCSLPHD